ncbi:MAG: hypothetical protein ACXWCG_09255 [Flavitalea sp.]
MRKAILLLLIVELFQQELMAQEKKESEKVHNNTIRFNVTNPVIFGGRSIIFGYERVLGKHRSFSVNIGQTGFPSLNLINSDSLKANSILGEKGFHISFDYRFYLSKENKYNAPRGVYIGPYYAYNYFERENSWTLKSTNGGSPLTAESKTSLSIHNLGVELGYQFIFWNRVALDMILIVPGIAAYNLKASLGSNLSEADKQKFFENLNQALAEKFPGYNRVIDEGEFQKKGSTNTTSFGFRYMIMIGYRF